MEEIWKDVPGYEGLYQVSNMGRVKSLERTREMNLPDHTTAPVNERIRKFGKSLGYQNVTLSKDGINKHFRVHKLVAMTFIPNPRLCTQINHKNGDKHDNRVENLEWCTPKENICHARETGLIKTTPSFKGHHHTKEAIRRIKDGNKWGTSKRHRVIDQYDYDGILFLRTWHGFVEIKKTLGFNGQNVQACCNGRIKHAYGYSWRYADE